LRSSWMRRGLLLALACALLLGLRAAVVSGPAPSRAQLLSAARKAATAGPAGRASPTRAGPTRAGRSGSRAATAGKAHAASAAKTPTPAILAKGALTAKLQEALSEQVGPPSLPACHRARMTQPPRSPTSNVYPRLLCHCRSKHVEPWS
jgi:hypothetical protein